MNSRANQCIIAARSPTAKARQLIQLRVFRFSFTSLVQLNPLHILMAFNDDLKLAIASTVRLEEFARSLSKTQGTGSSPRQQDRDPNRVSEQKASFLGQLANRLHAVRDWLETLSGSEHNQSSKVVKLLSNLDRLCVVKHPALLSLVSTILA